VEKMGAFSMAIGQGSTLEIEQDHLPSIMAFEE